MHRLIALLGAGLLLVGCVNIVPGSTVPPIRIPTVPPINLQSFPPIGLPSLPGGSGTCSFASAQEMAAIFGSAPAFTDDSSGDCAMVMATGVTVSISIDTNTDLQSSRAVMGNSARDITVGGLPGLSG